MRTPLMLALIAALSSPAHADKKRRSEAIFIARCARCHVIGQGAAITNKPDKIIDLTLSATKHDVAWMRAWLNNPRDVDPNAQCQPGGIDPVQQQLITSFMQKRSQPGQGSGAAQGGTRAPTKGGQ